MIQSGPTVAPKPEAQRNRPGFRGHDLEFNNFLLPSQRFEMRNLNGLPLGSARLLGGESLNVNRKVRSKFRYFCSFTS
jgi:hypothetical protein